MSTTVPGGSNITESIIKVAAQNMNGVGRSHRYLTHIIRKGMEMGLGEFENTGLGEVVFLSEFENTGLKREEMRMGGQAGGQILSRSPGR